MNPAWPGHDPDSRVFYSRTKGELERDLAALGYPSLTFVRPGPIGGERSKKCTGEWVATVVLGILAPVLPRAWRIAPASASPPLQAPPGQRPAAAGFSRARRRSASCWTTCRWPAARACCACQERYHLMRQVVDTLRGNKRRGSYGEVQQDAGHRKSRRA